MKNLILAPHIDDEAVGCGGILNESCYVYFCGVDRFHEVSQRVRLDEAENVSRFFGYKYGIDTDTTVNKYDGKQFIDRFQNIINEEKPDKVYIPYPSYNQDHREIYDAAMIALRPHDRNFFVKKVLVYEGMGAFQWYKSDYEVNHFVEIDIDRKMGGYSLHESQVRGHRSIAHIKALSRLRGSQIGVEFAEAYIVKRWVE